MYRNLSAKPSDCGGVFGKFIWESRDGRAGEGFGIRVNGHSDRRSGGGKRRSPDRITAWGRDRIGLE
ncbi:hypothetical protein [Phormidium sp. CCY1219]|uniref:hypothetical protein n=1 Tax=Phormidium sp. CCY1219 TaxID=2886104 RepID=UPI002D767374|nr:hypothetical protein [Phormidium sp. CCY1219]